MFRESHFRLETFSPPSFYCLHLILIPIIKLTERCAHLGWPQTYSTNTFFYQTLPNHLIQYRKKTYIIRKSVYQVFAPRHDITEQLPIPNEKLQRDTTWKIRVFLFLVITIIDIDNRSSRIWVLTQHFYNPVKLTTETRDSLVKDIVTIIRVNPSHWIRNLLPKRTRVRQSVVNLVATPKIGNGFSA